MSSDGGHRHRPPSAGGPQGPKAPDDPKYAGGGVEADREWARQRIASFYRAREADRAQAPILRKAEEARHAPASKPAPGAWRTRLTGGAPLPGEVRARMEPQLGADLSGVKVHNDGAAAEAAQGFGARAFTVGQDVHFNAGEYEPGTRKGDELLAHELTHTVQGQRAGVQRKAAEPEGEGGEHQAEGDEEQQVSQPGEPAEQEADAVAEKAAGNLHGEGEAAEGEAPGEKAKQAAPAIGAKLDGAPVMMKKGDKAAPKKQPPKTTTGRVPGTDPIPALSTEQTAKQKQQKKDQLKREQQPTDDKQRETPFKPLNDAQFEELEKKVQTRTATPEEVKHLEWDRRFNNRRKRGVDRFWAQEKQRIKSGQKPTRNWSPEQKAAILNDEVPKGPDGQPMEGHHMHNALDFPQKAADGKNITPATKDEHLNKWHGGNFQNDTHGKPHKPNHPDSF